MLNYADEVPNQSSIYEKIDAFFTLVPDSVYPLVFGGDLKACRDPDVVYGDLRGKVQCVTDPSTRFTRLSSLYS
jgi:hypothetical protein